MLAPASIEHRVDERDGRFELCIRAEDEAAATEALAGFDAEGEPEQQPPAPDVGWSPLGLLGAIAFAAMLLVTGVRAGGSRWFEAGSACGGADQTRRVVARGHRAHPARRHGSRRR